MDVDPQTGAAILRVKAPGYGILTVLIDPEDWERVVRHDWHARVGKNGRSYFYRKPDAYGGYGNGIQILLHRELLNAPPGIQVDHRNHNYLDNRKSELRLATSQQNTWNRRKVSVRNPSLSPFIGVNWNNIRGKWQSAISVNGQPIILGLYDNKVDAAKAYDTAALKHRGEFACLNFANRRLFAIRRGLWRGEP
jgi:hypothetical protein